MLVAVAVASPRVVQELVLELQQPVPHLAPATATSGTVSRTRSVQALGPERVMIWLPAVVREPAADALPRRVLPPRAFGDETNG